MRNATAGATRTVKRCRFALSAIEWTHVSELASAILAALATAGAMLDEARIEGR